VWIFPADAADQLDGLLVDGGGRRQRVVFSLSSDVGLEAGEDVGVRD
jgi:hypothetical protein